VVTLSHTQLIRLGHSPDPDDAFMFWALAANAIDTRGFRFEQVLQDIQTLNEWALEGRLEATAISLHAYPFVQDRYALLPHGASIGSGYGPILVAREPLPFDRLREAEIVVPGRMTTAFLTLRLALGDFGYRELPFDRILDEVASGRADAGLVIHEGQLTYAEVGLHKVLDLGEWWLLETGLPLPLGVNVARRDLGERLHDLSAVLLESIQAGLANRREAMRYAMRFGRGIDPATADRFVGMYVNELTCDYGDEGRKAVEELLRRGDAIGAFPEPIRLDYVS
jgi:1,4-dihydroxy-6-naphthoate synthase